MQSNIVSCVKEVCTYCVACATFRSSASRTCAAYHLELIGRLKSHGVWVCLTGDERLVLFHLVRAQEQMLFARMMASHVIPTENCQKPVKLDVRQVYC